jgi:hypothetical protein
MLSEERSLQLKAHDGIAFFIERGSRELGRRLVHDLSFASR